MDEGRYELSYILPKVSLSQIAVAGCVVQTDVNTRLEQVVLADDRVEKWLHIDAAVLIPVKFEKGGCTEEVSELQWQFGSHSQEGVIVQPLFIVVRRREVLS